MISAKDFLDIFEVEYLPSLFFSDKETLKKVIKRCRKQIKYGYIAEKEIWLGTYFEDEITDPVAPSVYIKWIDERKGYGLFASKDLKKDAFIGEYAGVVRQYNKRKDNKNSYCFEYQIGEIKKSHLTIDAKFSGNFTRFINHSYSPNLLTCAAYSTGVIHIIMKSSKFIPKDSELTYDYGPKYWKKRETPQ